MAGEWYFSKEILPKSHFTILQMQVSGNQPGELKRNSLVTSHLGHSATLGEIIQRVRDKLLLLPPGTRRSSGD